MSYDKLVSRGNPKIQKGEHEQVFEKVNTMRTNYNKVLNNKARNHNIYIKSDKHPRTINTPMMGRTYYTKVCVFGTVEDLERKVIKLQNAGEHITEISTDLGTKIYFWN